MDDLIRLNIGVLKFVSVEPIHEKIDHDFSGLDWIIVGAETGNRKGKVVPEKKWIKDIINKAKAKKIPLFIKNNTSWPSVIREFPTL